jgi:hypothetical protein
MRYLWPKNGYTLRGFKRITWHRTCRIEFELIREKDQKIIKAKGPDYESTLQMIGKTIEILNEVNKSRRNKFYLEGIEFIEPAYVESLVDLEGQSPVPPMWHIYLIDDIDDENKNWLVLLNRIPENIEEGVQLFQYIHDLNVDKYKF